MAVEYMPPDPPIMPYVPRDGDLFLAVLPLGHYSRHFAGVTYEEVMTLLPERNFATEFKPHEVDQYVRTFREANENLQFGQPVRRYSYAKYQAENGRMFVVVNQRGQ